MSLREEEKACLDKLNGLRESEAFKALAKLINIRYTIHKESLVVTSDDVTRGRAQECRTLLKELKLNGD